MNHNVILRRETCPHLNYHFYNAFRDCWAIHFHKYLSSRQKNIFGLKVRFNRCQNVTPYLWNHVLDNPIFHAASLIFINSSKLLISFVYFYRWVIMRPNVLAIECFHWARCRWSFSSIHSFGVFKQNKKFSAYRS